MDTMGEVRGIWTASESHEISSLIPPCARCSLVSMVCLSCTRHIVSPLSPRRLGRVPFWAYTTQWPLCLWALENGRIECIPKHLSSHLFALLACYRGVSLIWDRLCTHPILLLEVFLVENYFSLFGSNFRCVLFRLYEGETTTKIKSEGRFGVTRLGLYHWYILPQFHVAYFYTGWMEQMPLCPALAGAWSALLGLYV